MTAPFTVTSRIVKQHGPCAPGWLAHLRATDKRGEDDDPISIAEIVTGNSFENALFSARALPQHADVWRSFVAWCAARAEEAAAGSGSKQARDKAAQAAQCARQENLWDALTRCPALAQQASAWAAFAAGDDYKAAAAACRQQQIDEFLRLVGAP